MKSKVLFQIVISLFVMVAMGGCSKTEYDPEDYITSILTGQYGAQELCKLNVTENGVPMETNGYVRFDSKYLKVADFTFVNILPGIPSKTFEAIPLTQTESGYIFEIKYQSNDRTIVITGSVAMGQMNINLTSEPIS
ncbi:MAG: DUF4925 domain-containing protein [Muribaculaceae bacterium]|nr:DUF4925 domain-containing protein [Muribaculaceae bacterium]